jgi:hypothetical protein
MFGEEAQERSLRISEAVGPPVAAPPFSDSEPRLPGPDRLDRTAEVMATA